MEPVLIMMIIMSVPLAGIIGGTYLSAQKIKAKKGISDQEQKQLEQAIKQNKILEERLENLETIVISLDPELLTLKAHHDAEQNQKRLEALAQKLNAQNQLPKGEGK